MAGVASVCEECAGKRFEASVLDHDLDGGDISHVLAMSVTEAEEFFGAGEARTPTGSSTSGPGPAATASPIPTSPRSSKTEPTRPEDRSRR